MKKEILICLLAFFCQLTNADTSVCCWMEEVKEIAKDMTQGSLLETGVATLIDASASTFGCDKVCDDGSQWLPRVDANHI